MGIELSKGNPVSLKKVNEGNVVVNLKWSSRTDVDLACMYETRGGKKGVIQALDKNFGNLDREPFVLLDRDDRSGGSETMTVNLAMASYLKRLLVFGYIYEGGTWKNVGDAVATISHPAQGDYTVRLNPERRRTCALILLENDGAGGLTLTREEQYFKGTHEEVDQAYGWGMTWRRATKD